MAPKKGKKKGQRKKRMAPSSGSGDPAAIPAARGQLVGLRTRLDLNGRRVEVEEARVVGKDGDPRLKVRLLFGAGAGSVLKVKAANLELDEDRALDPNMQTLVTAMQALAPGAPAPEERRDWAGGLPIDVLAKIAETHVARTEATWAVALKRNPSFSEKDVKMEMAHRKRRGRSRGLFVFALVCKPWRKAQLKVGGRLRTRVESDVLEPGEVKLVEWALAEGCPREREDGHIMVRAAGTLGKREVVQWLCKNGSPMDFGLMACTANSGNLELMKWLRASGCPWDAWTCHHAALHGHLEVLRWARENSCDWQASACSGAAQTGHLEVIQWLRAKGCPWNYATCRNAAARGHVEMLRWARENGCAWDAQTRAQAARKFGYTDDFGNLVQSYHVP